MKPIYLSKKIMLCYMTIFIHIKKRLEGLHARLKQHADVLAKCNDIFIVQKEAGVIEKAPDSCEATL